MKGTFGDEQLERASVEKAPVLDRIDPRFEGGVDAGSAVRMSSDAPAQAMGRFDDRADFVIGELLVQSSLDVGEHAARGYELDRVRAMADLAAHRAATFVHAVANSRCRLHASANVVAIPIGLAMTAGGRKNGTDAKDTRPRNLPFRNGGPQCENNLGIT